MRFPKPEFDGDRRYDYALQLLQLALSKTGTEYRIEAAEFAMNQERQVLEIEAGRTIDVGPIPSSAEREARLLPIRIPVNKGMLGWRLGLIRKGDKDLIAGVSEAGRPEERAARARARNGRTRTSCGPTAST